MRFGIRAPLWKREVLTKSFLAHYAGMVGELREDGIDLVLVAVASQGPGYVRLVSPSPNPWTFIEHPNNPKTMGRKLTAGLYALRDKGVDAVLNLGSDDFVGSRTIRWLAREIDGGMDFDGWSDFYYVHPKRGMKRWPGYPRGSRRAGEPIGAGRAYSIRMLDALRWDLWPGGRLHRLDANVWRRLVRMRDKFDIRTTSSEEKGPMVDVKGATSVTPWRRLGVHNQDVPIKEARMILQEVGLSGVL